MKKLNIEDYIGKKYGRLTVVSAYRDSKSAIQFICKCECGKEKIIKREHLLNGAIKSCGCLNKQMSRNRIVDSFEKLHIEIILNEKPNKNNTSGIKGVSFNKQIGRFIAYLRINNKRYSKSFISKNDAISYRKYLEETYFKPVINKYKAEHNEPNRTPTTNPNS